MIYKYFENGFYGLKNENGDIIKQPIFNEIGEFIEEMAIINIYSEKYNENCYGYVNIYGEIVIEPIYKKIENFKNGKALVQHARVYGDSSIYAELIDKSGRTIKHFAWDNIKRLNNNFIYGEWTWSYRDHHETTFGYILNEDGYEIFKSYEPLNHDLKFRDGILNVGKNGTTHLINEKGESILQKELSIGIFINGKANIEIKDKLLVLVNTLTKKVSYIQYEKVGEISDAILPLYYEGKILFSDFDGNFLYETNVVKRNNYSHNLDRIPESYFTEGLCPIIKNDRYGFIDKTGNQVIDNKYFSTGHFYNGIAPVKLISAAPGVSYINFKGETIFEFEKYWFLGELSEFRNEIAFLFDTLNRRLVVIDLFGNEVCDLPYKEGLIIKSLKNKYFATYERKDDVVLYYEIFNPHGVMLFKIDNDLKHKDFEIIDFDGKYFVLKIEGRTELIDLEGECIYIEKYKLTEFNGEYGKIFFDNKFGLVDKNFEILEYPIFDDLQLSTHNYGSFKILGEWGFWDKSLNVIINPEYEGVGQFVNNECWIKNENKYGIINHENDFIIKPQFNNIIYRDKSNFIFSNNQKGFVDTKGKIHTDTSFEVKWNHI